MLCEEDRHKPPSGFHPFILPFQQLPWTDIPNSSPLTSSFAQSSLAFPLKLCPSRYSEAHLPESRCSCSTFTVSQLSSAFTNSLSCFMRSQRLYIQPSFAICLLIRHSTCYSISLLPLLSHFQQRIPRLHPLPMPFLLQLPYLFVSVIFISAFSPVYSPITELPSAVQNHLLDGLPLCGAP